MALYIPHSIFHLARLLYVRPETFGPYCVRLNMCNAYLVFIYGYVWVLGSDTIIISVSVIKVELSSIVEMLGISHLINSRPLI